MVGSSKIKKVNNWLVKPGTVHLVFDDVISYESIKNLSTRQIRDLVKDKIQGSINKINSPLRTKEVS